MCRVFLHQIFNAFYTIEKEYIYTCEFDVYNKSHSNSKH